jgi:glycogen operon protein
MKPEDWDDANMKCFGMMMDGRARPSGVRQRGTEAAMLLVMNAHHDLVGFTLPECPGGGVWSLEVDTNIDAEPLQYRGKAGDVYAMTGRSLTLFLRID